MILGRPINLWLGLVTAAAGALTLVLIAAGLNPTLVANLVGGGVSVMGALIALVAYQPPTVVAGSVVNVQTPPGETNRVVTV